MCGGGGGQWLEYRTLLKKGDEVVVLSGQGSGPAGQDPAGAGHEGKVIIEGLNLAKKHAKPTKASPQGGVIDKAVPVPAGKVMLVCSGCNKPTRMRREEAVDGEMVANSAGSAAGPSTEQQAGRV